MDTRPSTAHAVSPHEAAFINSLPMINDVIRAVCRRGRVSADEEKEFASSVILKLIGNDYQIFRQFRGGSAALRTFLFKVIHRHLMDRRNSEWGRWRPSKVITLPALVSSPSDAPPGERIPFGKGFASEYGPARPCADGVSPPSSERL